MEILEYLQSSSFSKWLSLSIAGFPTLIALHSVGMGVVVGLSLMVTLRLYGAITGFEIRLIPRLIDLALWGFTLNLVTGLAIFITRGPEYLGSAVFLIKMLLVAASAMTLGGVSYRLRLAEHRADAGQNIAKALSLLSTAFWFSAVVAGRLIAYLSDLYR